MLDADFEVERRDFTVRATLQVGPGERLALFGPSGAGKTTVLEVIAGLVPPRRGRVELHGRVLTSTTPPARVVPPWQRRVGLLRQNPGLFPHLSVRDNLCYAPSASPSAGELSASTIGITRATLIGRTSIPSTSCASNSWISITCSTTAKPPALSPPRVGNRSICRCSATGPSAGTHPHLLFEHGRASAGFVR